jgi:hypothetical protein
MEHLTIKPNDLPHVVLIKEIYRLKYPNKPPFVGKERAKALSSYREYKNPTATDSQCQQAITYLAMKIRNEVICPKYTKKSHVVWYWVRL